MPHIFKRCLSNKSCISREAFNDVKFDEESSTGCHCKLQNVQSGLKIQNFYINFRRETKSNKIKVAAATNEEVRNVKIKQKRKPCQRPNLHSFIYCFSSLDCLLFGIPFRLFLILTLKEKYRPSDDYLDKCPRREALNRTLAVCTESIF